METLLGRMSTTYRIIRRVWGRPIFPLFVAWYFFSVRTLATITLAMDRLLFPRLRTVQVKRPIILVGNPRTGTTFLQRWLSDNKIGAGMELWRMIFPSLTLQKVLGPFLPILEAISPAKYHSSAAHETNLSSVETDDVGSLFRNFDGFFLYGFFAAFDEEEHKDQFDPRHRNTNARDFAWFEELWKRSVISHAQERIIAKVFSLGPRIPAFLEKFPDASILYMARDPVEVIPSAMSLVTGVLDSAFGYHKLPEDVKRRWTSRLYTGLVDLMRFFHDDYVSGRIDRKRVYIVRYDRMMKEFDVVMAEMLAFLGHPPDAALQDEIDKRAEKQRKYKSEHKYDLAKYYLTEEQIRRDCAFFYDTFLPPLEPVAAAEPVQA